MRENIVNRNKAPRSERLHGGAARASKKQTGGMVHGKSAGSVIADIFIYLVLVLILAVCIVPMWHVLMASVSEPNLIAFGMGDSYKGGIVWWPVGEVTFAGYELVFEGGDILRGYLNTILYMVASTAIGMFINVTGGYVISRSSKLKPFFTLYVMFTAMFHGGIIPTYAVLNGLGMINNPLSVIIPGCTNAFFLVMLSNAFASVPESTIESAEIDGAGHMRIMWQIVLPQAMPLATVVVLNSLILQWNSWANASIFLSSNVKDIWPLALMIRDLGDQSENFMGSGGASNYDLYLIRYAVIIAGSLPMLCIFPFFQKKMESSVIVGAVKG